MATNDPTNLLPAIEAVFADLLKLQADIADPSLAFAALDADDARAAIAEDDDFAQAMISDFERLAQKYKEHDPNGAYARAISMLRSAQVELARAVAKNIAADEREAAADRADDERAERDFVSDEIAGLL